MIVLAAKTGMGKTSFAVQIGEHAASEGHPVAFFSLEMTRRQIEMRRLVARSRYPLSEIRRIEQGIHEGFEPQEKRDKVWSSVAQAYTQLAGAPFYVCDDTHQTILTLRTECTRLSMQEGTLGLVIIDYLQYLQPDTRRGDTREREVAALAQGLKAISKDLGVPVLALSQLSRASDKRSDPRPVLSDLRDSGQVEQEADAVLFLYTDEDLDTIKPGEMVRSEVIVAKQRNGQTGVVNVWWDRELFRYDDPSWHAIDKEEA
jgi:replicative DNA helicase